MSTAEKIEQLRRIKAHLRQGGGEKRIQRQHESGKMTARERIDNLFDQHTFQEMYLFAKHRSTNFGLADSEFPGDGVVTGVGTVQGRQVCVASQDFTVSGGAVGEMHADKIVRMADLAMKSGSPLVLINDSGGARIQEGIDAL
ncbi:MAG: acyl-CoA carboxylase subunit beta, partial [Chloroflexaceae bacterium]|nr:acyl-CoA carboxylase subunit beta [Chloroflexaceae bacterium]